uniref:Hep_Hag family protein n=1 Tax=uncultured marine virus TaxID=186617 RepID=A0A0F7LB02_9VIRU|nr:Hep_Hag family protein [uncultured marine virus]
MLCYQYLLLLHLLIKLLDLWLYYNNLMCLTLKYFYLTHDYNNLKYLILKHKDPLLCCFYLLC